MRAASARNAMASTSPIAAALDREADDIWRPIPGVRQEKPRGRGASSCLTYLMIGPIDVRRAPGRFSTGFAVQFASVRVGLRSDGSRVSPGLESREQVVRA